MADYKAMYMHLVNYMESAIVTLKKGEESARCTADVLYDTAAALQKAMQDTEEKFIDSDIPEA